MKKITVCICVFVVSILLIGVLSDGSIAGTKNKARRGDGLKFSAPAIKGSVVYSGMFSGEKKRKIHLNGQTIMITKNTRIFKTGEGLVEKGGIYVSNSQIYVAAVARKNGVYAKTIIVSDPVESATVEGKDAGVLDQDEPR